MTKYKNHSIVHGQADSNLLSEKASLRMYLDTYERNGISFKDRFTRGFLEAPKKISYQSDQLFFAQRASEITHIVAIHLVSLTLEIYEKKANIFGLLNN
jgi:hypothetical protein